MALLIPGTKGGPPLRLRKARDLRAGDLIDLSGDPYADPARAVPEFEQTYVEVLDVEQDTDTSVKIRWRAGELRFPIAHELLVLIDE